jgi:hypothetical protein
MFLFTFTLGVCIKLLTLAPSYCFCSILIISILNVLFLSLIYSPLSLFLLLKLIMSLMFIIYLNCSSSLSDVKWLGNNCISDGVWISFNSTSNTEIMLSSSTDDDLYPKLIIELYSFISSRGPFF